MASGNYEDELLQTEMEAVERLPANSEERLIRQRALAHLQLLARLADATSDDFQNENLSQEQLQAHIYNERQEQASTIRIAHAMREMRIEEDRRRREGRRTRRRRPGHMASAQARSDAEDLAPWLMETRKKADALIEELKNMINALYHAPAGTSVPETNTEQSGELDIGERSTADEPVNSPEESADQEVTEHAFYKDIRNRMNEVLDKATAFRNSIPLVETDEVQIFPTPESPPLALLPGQQASSLDPFIEFDYPLSLEDALSSAASQMLTPEDFENISLDEAAADWPETDNFSNDIKKWPCNPIRKRTSAEHHRSRRRDPFACKSPPLTKNMKSKVPTPLDNQSKKPSEKDNHKKSSKKGTVKKQSEKDPPKTPLKKSSRKDRFQKTSEKTPEKDEVRKSTRSDQGSRNIQTHGARPKTSSNSVWGKAVTSTPIWEISSPDQALVHMPIEEGSSPSTGYNSVANTPVCEITPGTIDCADVDNIPANVNPSLGEFSAAYSSGRLNITNLPVREIDARVIPPVDAGVTDLDFCSSGMSSPFPPPSIYRPPDGREIGEGGWKRTIICSRELMDFVASDIGASTLMSQGDELGNNGSSSREINVSNEVREQRRVRDRSSTPASSFDLDVNALKLESPSTSPTDNMPSSREISELDEGGELRIARVGSPSHALNVDLEGRALKLPSPSQTRRAAYVSPSRIGASDEGSLNKTTKITTSFNKPTSGNVSKGSPNTSIRKGATNTSIPKGTVSTSIRKGATNTSIPKGTGSTSIPKGTGSTSIPKGATSTSVPKGATSASVPKGATSASVPKGATSASVPKGATSASVPKGATSASVPKGATSASASKVVSNSSVPNFRTRIISRDGFYSITSRYSSLSTSEIGTSTGVPQRTSAVRGIGGASSTPSSKVGIASRRVSSGISRASKEPPSSASKPTFCIQSSKEVCRRREASKNVSVPIEKSSTQSSDSPPSGEETNIVSAPLTESTEIVPKQTSSTQPTETTASGEETRVGVPFAEVTSIVTKESFSQSPNATASGEETSVVGVPFVESAGIVLEQMCSIQPSEDSASGETSVSVPFAEATCVVPKETSTTKSPMATDANGETRVISIAEVESDVDIPKVESSEGSGIDSSSTSSEDNLPTVLEVLGSFQSTSSGPATKTKPISRQSDPTGRREATGSEPRIYHSM